MNIYTVNTQGEKTLLSVDVNLVLPTEEARKKVLFKMAFFFTIPFCVTLLTFIGDSWSEILESFKYLLWFLLVFVGLGSWKEIYGDVIGGLIQKYNPDKRLELNVKDGNIKDGSLIINVDYKDGTKPSECIQPLSISHKSGDFVPYVDVLNNTIFLPENFTISQAPAIYS